MQPLPPSPEAPSPPTPETSLAVIAPLEDLKCKTSCWCLFCGLFTKWPECFSCNANEACCGCLYSSGACGCKCRGCFYQSQMCCFDNRCGCDKKAVPCIIGLCGLICYGSASLQPPPQVATEVDAPVQTITPVEAIKVSDLSCKSGCCCCIQGCIFRMPECCGVSASSSCCCSESTTKVTCCPPKFSECLVCVRSTRYCCLDMRCGGLYSKGFPCVLMCCDIPIIPSKKVDVPVPADAIVVAGVAPVAATVTATAIASSAPPKAEAMQRASVKSAPSSSGSKASAPLCVPSSTKNNVPVVILPQEEQFNEAEWTETTFSNAPTSSLASSVGNAARSTAAENDSESGPTPAAAQSQSDAEASATSADQQDGGQPGKRARGRAPKGEVAALEEAAADALKAGKADLKTGEAEGLNVLGSTLVAVSYANPLNWWPATDESIEISVPSIELGLTTEEAEAEPKRAATKPAASKDAKGGKMKTKKKKPAPKPPQQELEQEQEQPQE